MATGSISRWMPPPPTASRTAPQIDPVTGQIIATGFVPSANVIDPNDLTPRFSVGGGFMDVPVGAVAGSTSQPQRGGAFLPPYLQPGGSTQIQPQSMLDRNAPAGSWDTTNNGVPNIPAAGGASASPFGRAGVTPTLTGVPGGITPRTGTPGTVAGILNQYNTGGRGGFSATAKMLELPYYLRRLGG